MRFILLTVTALFFQVAQAADVDNTNLIAVGQGISSPNSTSTINFSNSFMSESPIGTLYQRGIRLTGQYDKADENENIGAELGYGAQGEWGIAAGYRKADCDNCDGRAAGAVALNVSDIGVGLRFEEDLYAAALLLNPRGTHRVGFMGEFNKSGGDGANITAFGAGYSYVNSQFTFSIDGSKRSFENKTIKDDRLLVTPGVMLRSGMLQLSLNDRITLNRDKNDSNQDGDDHDIWFGIGLGGDKFHIAVYADYVNDIALAGSVFF